MEEETSDPMHSACTVSEEDLTIGKQREEWVIEPKIKYMYNVVRTFAI